MTILKYTDDAVIIGNIAVDADSENYLHLDEIDRINLLSTPACRGRTTGPLHAPKLFEVKILLVRQTDHKNGSSEEAEACVCIRHLIILLHKIQSPFFPIVW